MLISLTLLQSRYMTEDGRILPKMERVTREDLNRAKETQKLQGRRFQRITFPADFVDRVETAAKKADRLLAALRGECSVKTFSHG